MYTLNIAGKNRDINTNIKVWKQEFYGPFNSEIEVLDRVLIFTGYLWVFLR